MAASDGGRCNGRGDRNVYVCGLPAGIDEEELTEMFECFGPIVSATVSASGQLGGSAGSAAAGIGSARSAGQGCGFVCFESAGAAQTAIASMRGFHYRGAPIHVKLAGYAQAWGSVAKPTGLGQRVRVTNSRITGRVDSWKGQYGWISADVHIDHPDASKHDGRIFVNVRDVESYRDAFGNRMPGDKSELRVGERVSFAVYKDNDGLGACEVRLEMSGGGQSSSSRAPALVGLTANRVPVPCQASVDGAPDGIVTERVVMRVKYAGTEQAPSNNLYVSGLPSPTIVANVLRGVFQERGLKVLRIRLLPDNRGKGQSAAMVLLFNQDMAEKSISLFDGKDPVELGLLSIAPSSVAVDVAQESFLIEDATRSVCIDGWPPGLQEFDLRQTFEQFGRITKAVVHLPLQPGARASGLVVFSKREDAQAAADSMDGMQYGRFPLVVRLAARGQSVACATSAQEDSGDAIESTEKVMLQQPKRNGGRATGTVVKWKGGHGWIKPDIRIEHPAAEKHGPWVYVDARDVEQETELQAGDRVSFLVYADPKGIGGSEVRKLERAPSASERAQQQAQEQAQVSTATKKRDWWRDLTGDCCPISLTPLEELPYEPFGLRGTAGDGAPASATFEGLWGAAAVAAFLSLQAVHWFDGMFLACFLVAKDSLIDPVNMRALCRTECAALDEYLCANGLPAVHVAEAFDLTLRAANGSTCERDAERLAALRRDAASTSRIFEEEGPEAALAATKRSTAGSAVPCDGTGADATNSAASGAVRGSGHECAAAASAGAVAAAPRRSRRWGVK
eukprot:TRINITY_DN65212_c0_g1_i2.p1 TRINITY_DN65212_c0_g1~~TRINITY_DN65212_c0_g1_i2.p1  ORF type:complete len:793 (-),score=131.61 TRINITY_DN65212_c0_g1_i2:30-2408(-)